MIQKAKHNCSMSATPSRLQPGSVIGILGNGQLGRMLALAAARLGLSCHIYSDRSSGPAADVAAQATQGHYDDTERLNTFAAAVDVITYEVETVPLRTATHLANRKPVYPPPGALAVAQDRLTEKQFLQKHGIAVAPYEPVSSEMALVAAIRRLSAPAILKTRSSGFDGRGQVRIMADTDLAQAYKVIDRKPAILEGHVQFQREISVILARGLSPDGSGKLVNAIYDIPMNIHEQGILKCSKVPAPICEKVRVEAEEIACRIAEALDYIGVLAVELFEVREGSVSGQADASKLIVNEIAPRVHNSGHWTMDACFVGQFENHIRAIAGWPLGTTDRFADVEMINLIGSDIDQWQSLLEQPGATLHHYGKGEVRPLRKMGHVNKLKRTLPY